MEGETHELTSDRYENGRMIYAESEDNEAIRVYSACKSYKGSGGKTTQILNKLNLQVPKGKIYGLLGPSGCGKTSLLKVMLGNLSLDSGNVTVFGQSPGSRVTGVPGRRVGYMPQELALFGEFNIEETLEYFSRLYGMPRKRFLERMAFLIKFLDLPSQKRILDKMSGGQQRRASLAVALLHEPDLLLLDEPTVGVDPLLRQSIWQHLVDLTTCTKNQGTTIVITTHYTEEAMQAHNVGMMRAGRMLAEGSPQLLLEKHEKVSLEDVFLDLCLLDVEPEEDVDGQEIVVINEKMENGDIWSTVQDKEKKTVICDGNGDGFSWPMVSACMRKTFNRMKKRWGLLIYTFLLPALQMSLFCLAIGQDPVDLPVAVVNEEVDIDTMDQCSHNYRCPLDKHYLFGTPEANQDLSNFSCRYLGFLDTKVVTPIFYDSIVEAKSAVEAGHAWGVLHMSRNFSQELYGRIMDLATCTGSTDCQTSSPESKINVRLDVTNQQIAFTIQLKLIEAFQKFLEQLVDSCNYPADLASLPLEFDIPIYGSNKLTFTDFMAPGIILTIVHSMALGFSAMIIIIERNEGLLDRTWVAGVTPSEFSLANFLCSTLVNLVQVILTLGFMLVVFQMPVVGSGALVVLLTLLQGMSGTTIGLFISSVCRTQQDATQIALGIFYPNMILSGILWPLEAMPKVLRYIAYCLPQTLACEAMRSILMRGWGLEHAVILRGFLVTIVWIVIAYFMFKLKMHKSR